MTKTCPECGVVFHRKGGHGGENYKSWEIRIYCSKDCYAAVRSRRPMANGTPCQGYIVVYVPGKGPRRRCRVIAEKAFGKPLPRKYPVHHFNEIKADDSNTNLVICEDAKYHALLHIRAKVFRAGGDPNTQSFCSRCKELKNNSQFWRLKAARGLDSYCISCHKEYKIARKYDLRRILDSVPTPA